MSVRQAAMARALKRPNNDQTKIQEDQRGWKPGRKPRKRHGLRYGDQSLNLNIPGNMGGNRRT